MLTPSACSASTSSSANPGTRSYLELTRQTASIVQIWASPRSTPSLPRPSVRVPPTPPAAPGDLSAARHRSGAGQAIYPSSQAACGCFYDMTGRGGFMRQGVALIGSVWTRGAQLVSVTMVVHHVDEINDWKALWEDSMISDCIKSFVYPGEGPRRNGRLGSLKWAAGSCCSTSYTKFLLVLTSIVGVYNPSSVTLETRVVLISSRTIALNPMARMRSIPKPSSPFPDRLNCDSDHQAIRKP